MSNAPIAGPCGALAAQLAAFRRKFGRAMTISDPLFFDPEAETLQPMAESEIEARWDFVLEVLKDGGVRPEILFAARKTGYLLPARVRTSVSISRSVRWDRAVAEYRRSKPVLSQAEQRAVGAEAEQTVSEQARTAA